MGYSKTYLKSLLDPNFESWTITLKGHIPFFFPLSAIPSNQHIHLTDAFTLSSEAFCVCSCFCIVCRKSAHRRRLHLARRAWMQQVRPVLAKVSESAAQQEIKEPAKVLLFPVFLFFSSGTSQWDCSIIGNFHYFIVAVFSTAATTASDWASGWKPVDQQDKWYQWETRTGLQLIN